MTIAELNRRINAVDVNKLADEALKEHELKVVEANKQQLLEGYKADDTRMFPKYKSKSYARWKYNKNPLAGLYTPDLKKTGDFYKGFFLKLLGNNQYSISSTDSKTPMLTDESRYTPKIFGLNNDNAEELGYRYVQPSFINRLKLYLFK